MAKRGKKYLEAKALVKTGEKYSIDKAVELVKKVSYSNFDATIEIHIKTRANPKYNDQMIRCTVTLPN
jgi:large subunit ribosomal protein L1